MTDTISVGGTMFDDAILSHYPTPENLRRIGWGYWNHTAHMRTDRSPIGHRLVAYREYWRLELGFNAVDKIPVPATMGDVLVWHRLLKIPCEVPTP